MDTTEVPADDPAPTYYCGAGVFSMENMGRENLPGEANHRRIKPIKRFYWW